MPTDKDFKRTVRARMAKTGESYTAARAQLLKSDRRGARGRAASKDGADLATRAGMRDAAVAAKTGRTWAQWVAVLDAVDAASWSHREIARHLGEVHDLGGWWRQSVAGGYERIKGLREINQRRDGSYDVNRSRTLPVDVTRLYRAFSARERRQWLPDVPVTVRSARVDRSLRLTWDDGTPVDVHVWDKGPGKSQVQIQQRGLPDRAALERQRAAWGAHLDALAAWLRR